MRTVERCGHCGARTRPGAERCAYCRSALGPATGAAPDSGGGFDGERGRTGPTGPPADRSRGFARFALFMLCFIAVGAYMAWSSRGDDGLPHPVPVVFVLIGVALLIRGWRRRARRAG